MPKTWESKGFFKIASLKYGEVIICKTKKIRDMALKQKRFAVSINDLQEIKSIEDEDSRKLFIEALNIFEGKII